MFISCLVLYCITPNPPWNLKWSYHEIVNKMNQTIMSHDITFPKHLLGDLHLGFLSQTLCYVLWSSWGVWDQSVSGVRQNHCWLLQSWCRFHNTSCGPLYGCIENTSGRWWRSLWTCCPKPPGALHDCTCRWSEGRTSTVWYIFLWDGKDQNSQSECEWRERNVQPWLLVADPFVAYLNFL